MGCNQSCCRSDTCEPEQKRDTEPRRPNASRAQSQIQSQVSDEGIPAASATCATGTEKDGTARTRAHSTTRRGTTDTFSHKKTKDDSPSKSALKTRPTVSTVPRASELEIVTCENDQLRQMGVVGRDKTTGNLKWSKAAMGTEHARDHCLSNWGRANMTANSNGGRHVPHTIGTASGQRQTQEKNLVCFSDDTTIGNPRAFHPKRDGTRNSRSQSQERTPEKRTKVDHRFASPLDSLHRRVKLSNKKTAKPKFLLEVAFDTPPESPYASDDERERAEEGPNRRFGATSSTKPLQRRHVSLSSKPQVMVLGSKASQPGGDPRTRFVKQTSDSRVSMEYALTTRTEGEGTESLRRTSNNDLENRRFPDGPFSLGTRFPRPRSHSASMPGERKEGETLKQRGRWSKTSLRQPNRDGMRESVRERALRRASIDSGDSPLNLLDIQIRDSSAVLGGGSQRRHFEDSVESSLKTRMQSVWAHPLESGGGHLQANVPDSRSRRDKLDTPDSMRGSRTEECESAYNHSRKMCVCYRQDACYASDGERQPSFGQGMGTHPMLTVRHNNSNGSVYANGEP